MAALLRLPTAVVMIVEMQFYPMSTRWASIADDVLTNASNVILLSVMFERLLALVLIDYEKSKFPRAVIGLLLLIVSGSLNQKFRHLASAFLATS